MLTLKHLKQNNNAITAGQTEDTVSLFAWIYAKQWDASTPLKVEAVFSPPPPMTSLRVPYSNLITSLEVALVFNGRQRIDSAACDAAGLIRSLLRRGRDPVVTMIQYANKVTASAVRLFPLF